MMIMMAGYKRGIMSDDNVDRVHYVVCNMMTAMGTLKAIEDQLVFALQSITQLHVFPSALSCDHQSDLLGYATVPILLIKCPTCL